MSSNNNKQGGLAASDEPAPALSQHKHHPFGKENTVSGQQLFVSFCNNLYLGQWELARSCAQKLARPGTGADAERSLQNQHDQREEDGSQQTNTLQVLKAVVRHPYYRLVLSVLCPGLV